MSDDRLVEVVARAPQTFDQFRLPLDSTGLALCKVVKDNLRMTETVMFRGGVSAVDTILRRAQV